jgi:hypothetical protein
VIFYGELIVSELESIPLHWRVEQELDDVSVDVFKVEGAGAITVGFDFFHDLCAVGFHMGVPFVDFIECGYEKSDVVQ